MLDHQSHPDKSPEKSQDSTDRTAEKTNEKTKVTLYLSPDTHRQLKVLSAIEATTMYALAEKAISFYLAHPDIVEHQGYGHTHRLHTCPQCAEKLVFHNGTLVSVVSSHDGESTRESARDLILTGSAN